MIHPSALIDPSAKIGSNCEIGPFSVIGADVVLGDECVIASHVVIKGPTQIGARTKIFQFASIGEAPQDLKYHGEPTQLIVGSDNIIRENVTLNRGTVGGGGRTVIGDHNLIMAYCHVAHDCLVGNHVVFSNGTSLAGHVNVGDYAILGGFTLVHQFVRIGSGAFTGMGSGVSQDVPPFVLAAGNHAKAKGLNKVGLRRRGYSEETIRGLYRAFRGLLRRRGDLQSAVDELGDLPDQYPEVAEFLAFVRGSERGCIR